MTDLITAPADVRVNGAAHRSAVLDDAHVGDIKGAFGTIRLGETLTYYQEPAFEKLLPDPEPSFERPYTLCISLEDMLVHSAWTREHGWRVVPACSYAASYLARHPLDDEARRQRQSDLLDEALDESFPASDPPAVGDSS